MEGHQISVMCFHRQIWFYGIDMFMVNSAASDSFHSSFLIQFKAASLMLTVYMRGHLRNQTPTEHPLPTSFSSPPLTVRLTGEGKQYQMWRLFFSPPARYKDLSVWRGWPCCTSQTWKSLYREGGVQGGRINIRLPPNVFYVPWM